MSKNEIKYTRNEALLAAEIFNNKYKEYIDDLIIVGSFRREKEELKDIDFLIIPKIENFQEFRDILLVDKYFGGDYRREGLLKVNDKQIKIDILFAMRSALGSALLHSTGPFEFNVYIRARAKRLGYKLNQYGLFIKDTNFLITSQSEEEILNYLGICYIAPHYRDKIFDLPTSATIEEIESFTTKNKKYYIVLINGKPIRCSCEHYIHRLQGTTQSCKHMDFIKNRNEKG